MCGLPGKNQAGLITVCGLFYSQPVLSFLHTHKCAAGIVAQPENDGARRQKGMMVMGDIGYTGWLRLHARCKDRSALCKIPVNNAGKFCKIDQHYVTGVMIPSQCSKAKNLVNLPGNSIPAIQQATTATVQTQDRAGIFPVADKHFRVWIACRSSDTEFFIGLRKNGHKQSCPRTPG